jgi:hypothetical protein
MALEENGFGNDMAGPNATLNMLGKVALIVALVAILSASGWYAARAWLEVSGPPMPLTGYIAMTLGVVFSLVVGCGLMALLFYSNRHGYDEPYREDEHRDGV